MPRRRVGRDFVRASTGLLTGVLLAGLVFWWWGSSSPDPRAPKEPPSAAVPSHDPAVPSSGHPSRVTQRDAPVERAPAPGEFMLRGVVLDHEDRSLADFPFQLVPESGRTSGDGSARRAREESIEEIDVEAANATRVSSDADGRFVVPSIAKGRYRVASVSDRFGVTRPLEIVVDGSPGELELELLVHPLVAIRGRVLDDYGQPLAGVRVHSRSLVTEGLFVSDPASTDADGHFTIDAAYDLRAAGEIEKMIDFASRRGENEAGMDPRSTMDLCVVLAHPRFERRAEPVWPSEAPIDLGNIALVRPRLGRSGRLTDLEGQPVAGGLSFHYVGDGVGDGVDGGVGDAQTTGRDAANATGGAAPRRCSDLELDANANSGRDGRFEVGLQRPGAYEVTITPSTGEPRFVEIYVDDSKRFLEIQIE